MCGIDTNICIGFEIIAGDGPTDVKLSVDGDILTTGILNIRSVLAAGLFSLIDTGRNKNCRNVHLHQPADHVG